MSSPIYVYQGALWCDDCGAEICSDLRAAGEREGTPAPDGGAWADFDPAGESYDSDDFPKGPLASGEADSPQYCDGCQELLDHELTEDGRRYVVEAITRYALERRGSVAVLRSWADAWDVGMDDLLAPNW